LLLKQRQKGFQAERELARRLWEKGLAVVRGPASGAGARRIFYPDLVVLYKGSTYVLEVKVRSKPEPIIIKPPKSIRMLEFASRAGAKIFVAIKTPKHGWRFVEVRTTHVSSDGSIRIASNEVESGLSFEDFLRLVKAGSTRLTDYM
jgi:Holliday junction resolvase